MSSQTNLYFDKQLLDLSYKQAVDLLLKKYGPATDDYFREKSYQRLVAGEIQHLTKGTISRTKEGLYCHHQAEDRYLNMAQADYIRQQHIPFAYQRADQLVYCDLAEHAVLHTLITIETNGRFGLPGLDAFLAPMIRDWYIDGHRSNSGWQRACFDKAFLSADDAKDLFEQIGQTLSTHLWNKKVDLYVASELESLSQTLYQ